MSCRARASPYEVAAAAAEFVLRKDYRADWGTEVLEEYTYLSQPQFEEAFRSRGLRIVTSRPLWNPWIVQNRFEGKFHLSDLGGNPLPFPPTNYLIVGEKVRAGGGVALRAAAGRSRRRLPEPQRLQPPESGASRSCRRPNKTVPCSGFESRGRSRLREEGLPAPRRQRMRRRAAAQSATKSLQHRAVSAMSIGATNRSPPHLRGGPVRRGRDHRRRRAVHLLHLAGRRQRAGHLAAGGSPPAPD